MSKTSPAPFLKVGGEGREEEEEEEEERMRRDLSTVKQGAKQQQETVTKGPDGAITDAGRIEGVQAGTLADERNEPRLHWRRPSKPHGVADHVLKQWGRPQALHEMEIQWNG